MEGWGGDFLDGTGPQRGGLLDFGLPCARAEAPQPPPGHSQEARPDEAYPEKGKEEPMYRCTTVKRPRVEKTAPAPAEASSSKRSRAEKHSKEIRLLCEALAPHIPNIQVERSVRLYDKYRDSGKAAGRPSRPMYAAVVLAMSGDEDEEGDESDCKNRLQLVANACSAVWGADAPDKRKIWDSLIVLLRIVPLRGPQDNLAGSVLSRLFRSIKFSSEEADEEATKQLLVKLATTLEQGPLAGKAPKTVAACTMHLYCRHINVGLQAGRTIANSLQVGESTVRTNLRGIYVGKPGACQMLLSEDAQEILDKCPKPSNFELCLPAESGRPARDDAGEAARLAKAVPARSADSMLGIAGVRGGGFGKARDGAEGGDAYANPGRDSPYTNPPPLVSTPQIHGSASVAAGPMLPASHGSHALPQHALPQQAGAYFAQHRDLGVLRGGMHVADEDGSSRGSGVPGGEGLFRGGAFADGRYSSPQQHGYGGGMGGESSWRGGESGSSFEPGIWSDGY